MGFFIAFLIGIITALGGKVTFEKIKQPIRPPTGQLESLAKKADKQIENFKKIKDDVDEIDRESRKAAVSLRDKLKAIFD